MSELLSIMDMKESVSGKKKEQESLSSGGTGRRQAHRKPIPYLQRKSVLLSEHYA
jgi:hypothetical protein